MNHNYFNRAIDSLNKLSFLNKYLVIFILVITVISLNYFHYTSMMLLTISILTYLSKGSRCK